MDTREALKQGIATLRAANVASHTLAAELLLMHALQRDRAWLYTHPEEAIDPASREQYFALIARRAAGEPTQYLTGKQEFWGLAFEVTPAILIPRPETEHLVEVALERLGSRGLKINMATGAASPSLRMLDVGTGSGCLAVALAYELPHAEIIATDISAAAIEVAQRNAKRHGVGDRIRFLRGDLLEGFLAGLNASGHKPAGFDLIVSNPPYVSEKDFGGLAREVKDHEPRAALLEGLPGTGIYERLIAQAYEALRSSGIIVLELGYDSLDCVRALFGRQPGWDDLRLTNDLAGIPRVISAVRR